MPYCANCGHLVGDEARYCSNCATPLPGSGEGQVSGQLEAGSLDTVPSWLGWLALPMALLTSIIGLGLYSYWAYRRGRREGVGLDPTVEPYDNFGWRVVGWGVASFVPILGLWVVFHLPTICFKQGLRVSAKKGTEFGGFTSFRALGAAFVGILAVAVAALLIIAPTLGSESQYEAGAELTEEERVIAEVSTLYRHFSEGDYLALWSVYTSAFQNRCSFDDMVAHIEEYKRSTGWDRLVPIQVEVNVLDDQAVTSYTVEARAGSRVVDRYEYSITYFEESGEWRAQEHCFPPR